MGGRRGSPLEEDLPVQELQGGSEVRQRGWRDRRGAGAPPRHRLRLGVRRGHSVDAQDKRADRERLRLRRQGGTDLKTAHLRDAGCFGEPFVGKKGEDDIRRREKEVDQCPNKRSRTSAYGASP